MVVESSHPLIGHVADLLPLLPQFPSFGIADLRFLSDDAGFAVIEKMFHQQYEIATKRRHSYANILKKLTQE